MGPRLDLGRAPEDIVARGSRPRLRVLLPDVLACLLAPSKGGVLGDDAADDADASLAEISQKRL